MTFQSQTNEAVMEILRGKKLLIEDIIKDGTELAKHFIGQRVLHYGKEHTVVDAGFYIAMSDGPVYFVLDNNYTVAFKFCTLLE